MIADLIRSIRFLLTRPRFGDLVLDLRHTFRLLKQAPAFTAAVLTVQALGIGANTAIFSIAYTVLFRPLPYPEPERLVMIWETRSDIDPSRFPNPQEAAKLFNRWLPNDRTFALWRDRGRSFECIAGFGPWAASLTGGGEPERIEGSVVTPEFFRLLGVSPALGRTFLPDEDTRARHDVIVLGYGLWQRRFASDPAVLGRTLIIDGTAHTVIGVMPAGFETVLPDMKRRPDFYLPSWHMSILNPGFTISRVLGRLKPSVPLAQAQAEMGALAAALQRELPRSQRGHGARLETLAREMSAEARPAMLVLLGAVGCVLLLCCANIANLLLARATVRQREIGIRVVLGASERRIARQLLTESAVLGVAGGLAGIWLAHWAVRLLVAVIPQGAIPRVEDIRVDAGILTAGVCLSLLASLLFGLVPAIEAARWHRGLGGMLEASGGRLTATRRSQRLRVALVVTEIVIAVVLLTGAGLLVRSFIRLRAVDLGFRAENVIAGVLTVDAGRHVATARQVEFMERVLERVRAIPSVTAAAFASQAPMVGDITVSVSGITMEGRAADDVSAMLATVTPGYFRAIGTAVRKGREFTAGDTVSGAVIVNEAFVKRYLPDVRRDSPEPVGRHLRWNELNLPVVGVVADSRSRGPESELEPQMFVTHTSIAAPAFVLIVRTAGDLRGIAPLLRASVWAVNPDQPVSRVVTLEQAVSESVARPRFYMLLLGGFAGLALVLAAIGIGGVVAYSAAQRTREIGIRMALGAGRGSVYRMIVGQGLLPAVAGLGIGLAASAVVTRVLGALLFEVGPLDAGTYAAVTLLLLAIAVAASWLPAWRAVRVDPQAALRWE